MVLCRAHAARRLHLQSGVLVVELRSPVPRLPQVPPQPRYDVQPLDLLGRVMDKGQGQRLQTASWL